MYSDLISVIVPVYKVEKYLNRCVESIVNQTYKNLEIILVDDGSPDNCPQMCDKWAEKDSRIKVIHQENAGLAEARNSGISVATGKFFMFIDSDDFAESDMIELLLNLSMDYNADVSSCGFYFDYENDNKAEACDFSDEIRIADINERIIDLLTGGFSGTVWNKLYRADAVKSILFDKADGCSEDIMYNYRVYKQNITAVFCGAPKYHYLIRSSSITNREFTYGAFDIIRAKRLALCEQANNPNVFPYAVKGFVMSAFIVLSGCIQSNKFPKEKQQLVDEILSFKKEILNSKIFSKTDKIKVLILSFSPRLYEKIIIRKHL